METFDRMGDLLNSISKKGVTYEVYTAFLKSWNKIHGFTSTGGEDDIRTLYPVIMESISGGSDSDIMLDMTERIGYPASKVFYVFFDTGLEFKATKRHLDYLEERYGIKIMRVKAKTPVPLGVKKYGVPFLSKQVSQYISRLQKHGFKWEDRPFDELYAEYPKCKAALRWWCNAWGKNSRVNIEYHKWLKEFMVENPPDFPISDGCCRGAKKYTAHKVEREINPDLICQGVRKGEGGVRSTVYKSCFDKVYDGADIFRPIFWFQNKDKRNYEEVFQVKHSDCYEKYGLTRTGCACCPFGRNFEKELRAAELYEPNLYRAAINVFGKAYEYTRKYREFCEKKKQEKQKHE